MSKNRKVLLFTGAGAGVPLGLPTSTGFTADIAELARPVTASALKYLGKRANDIEWVLSALEQFATEIALTEYLLPQLVDGSSVAKQGQQHIQNRLARFKLDASAEIVRLKKKIFDRLSAFLPDAAGRLYVRLLQDIFSTFSPCALSIMTTNYDLAVETAIEQIGDGRSEFGIDDVDYGFSTRFGRPVYDARRDFAWKPSVVEFLKLHGSLDWHRDAQGLCGRSMSRTIPDDPDQMPILFPGFKGVPDTEPFVSLHGRLSRRLTEADVVLVIGFAFRDAYINTLFENALRLRPNRPIHYFDPLPLSERGDDSAAARLAGGYPGFKHHVHRFAEDKGLPLETILKDGSLGNMMSGQGDG
jgi:hypothetical protein